MPRAPDQPLDVQRLAAATAVLEFEFAIEDFGRLRDRLASMQGQASAVLALTLEEGVPVGELSVRAELSLTCQRCLGVLRRTIESESRLAFVAGEGSLPPDCEAIVGDASRIAIAPLVEDELLLALPLVALHGADESCGAPQAGPSVPAAEDDAHGRRRPFANLRELLKTEPE